MSIIASNGGQPQKQPKYASDLHRVDFSTVSTQTVLRCVRLVQATY